MITCQTVVSGLEYGEQPNPYRSLAMDKSHPYETQIFHIIQSPVASPAAGSPCTITVPDNCRFQLQTLYAWFTSDATVIARMVYVYINDGINVYQIASARRAQINSLTYYYFYSAGSQIVPGISGTEPITTSSLGHEIILLSPATIVLTARDIQAADQFSRITYTLKIWRSIDQI